MGLGARHLRAAEARLVPGATPRRARARRGPPGLAHGPGVEEVDVVLAGGLGRRQRAPARLAVGLRVGVGAWPRAEGEVAVVEVVALTIVTRGVVGDPTVPVVVHPVAGLDRA